MAQGRKRVNPDLVRQEVEKGRIGDRELAKKPGRGPKAGIPAEGAIWDDDQRQLVENQDMSEIEKAEEKNRST